MGVLNDLVASVWQAWQRVYARPRVQQLDPAETSHSSTRIVYIPKTEAGVRVSEDTALTYAAVFACVRIIAETMGSLSWHVFRQRSGGGKERVPGQIEFLLRDQPNPETTAFSWREQMVASALLWGGGFAEIVRDGAGRVVELWQIAPDRVTIDRVNGDGRLIYDIDNRTGGNTVLEANDCFHLHGLGFDGITGYSVVRLAARSIGIGMASERFAGAFYGNGTWVSGVLEAPGPLSETAVKHLRESWEEMHRGSERSFKPAILEEGLKFSQLGMPMTDAQFLESRKFQVNDIARWFRVPPHKLADLERATFCLPASAKVYTLEGPRSIAQVRAGEWVWTREDGKWRVAQVERSECTGIDRILAIRTTNREIRLNAKHRVLARKAIHSPKAGPGGYQSLEWRSEWVAAGELRVGDTIVALEKLPMSERRLAPNGRRLTDQFMALCGLILGDGNVFAGSVSIARAGHASYMDYYRNAASQEFQASAKGGVLVANARGRRPIVLRESERQTRFSSVLAAQELQELGFGGTARSKKVPGWVFLLAEDLQLAFLAGFLDADGSVDKLGRMAFHSVNKELAEGMRHLCMGLGIPVTNLREAAIRTKLPNGEWCDSIICTFTCSDPGQNRRVPTATPLYAERMASGRPFGRKGRAYPRYGGRGFVEDGCSLSRIVSIEEQPAEPVYDLAVMDTHNFVADGVVVHNSNIEHQALEFVQDTVLPWAVRLEQEANRKLFGQNRQGFFTKLNLNALLRGDAKSRFDAYATGRQWGWLSANDIRELEDMNPIGPQGDVYLAPVNMVNAKQFVGATTAPPPPQIGIQETEDEDDEPMSVLRAAHRDLVASAFERIGKREQKWCESAKRKFDGAELASTIMGFLTSDGHRSYATEALMPPLLAFARIVFAGRVTEQVEAVLHDTVDLSLGERLVATQAHLLAGGDAVSAKEEADRLIDRVVELRMALPAAAA